MGNDLERLNRWLDDLAAERDVAERAALSAADMVLAEMAAFLAHKTEFAELGWTGLFRVVES
jgi:hypothetical protein